jgi:hypothetical protein
MALRISTSYWMQRDLCFSFPLRLRASAREEKAVGRVTALAWGEGRGRGRAGIRFFSRAEAQRRGGKAGRAEGQAIGFQLRTRLWPPSVRRGGVVVWTKPLPGLDRGAWGSRGRPAGIRSNPGLRDGVPPGFAENAPPTYPASAERRKMAKLQARVFASEKAHPPTAAPGTALWRASRREQAANQQRAAFANKVENR